jgi:hypothetical protein
MMQLILTTKPSKAHQLLIWMRNDYANLMGPFAWEPFTEIA